MTGHCLIFVWFYFAVAVVWSCPAGWIEHGPACYHMGPEEETWFDGMKMCQIHGSNLASVESQEEQNFIVSLMRNSHKTVVWLGGSDWTVEGKFVWEPYGDDITYSNYAPGEPNNHHGVEDCLLIDGSSHKDFSFTWDDRNCDDQHYYICKQMDDVTGNLVG
uniref:Perlucin-like protein isoform X1 n=1 Tax=Crassostrea virginica TaxID=6565 RepID=A0A8B8E6U3_CRAVI|nr:perlucin-like protein isoform X1 [Crassostrea virginica]XP_022335146.1 perlucin-like protein isoform X1 [Crassostrea virginica]